MKESQQDSSKLEEALTIVHKHEAQMLCAAFMHSPFAAIILQSQLWVTDDRVLIECANRTVADVWCDKCVELCNIVFETLKLPLRVVISWLGCRNMNYDIPTHTILGMSVLEGRSGNERSFQVLEQVLSGLGDQDERQVLDEVMNEDEARCLVELESDRPIICNNKLAELVRQSAAQWRRTDLRRHWSDNPKQFQNQQDDAPDYLKEVKTALTQRSSILISYDTWLTDEVFGSFRSLFALTNFQKTPSRQVTIYSFAEHPTPVFA